MATGDNLRVGDAERESIADELREHYAQGRLTLEDFERRLEAAMAASTRADLDQLVRDLPHTKPPGAPLPASSSGNWRQHGRGHGGGPGGPRRRALLGRVSALLAAVASVLIVFDFMAGLRFPLPGRLGLLVAIFMFVRTLIRWMLRLGRRRF
jgi:Domain of unknown function (DUF1707)